VQWAEYSASIRNILQQRQLVLSGKVLNDDQLNKINLIRAANLIQDAKEELEARPRKWASRQLASREVELLVRELSQSQNEWVDLQEVESPSEFFQLGPLVTVPPATEPSLRSEYEPCLGSVTSEPSTLEDSTTKTAITSEMGVTREIQTRDAAQENGTLSRGA
jgi:hypothetical protein